jgi:transcriptional regulator with XRE-family HTH domain
MISPRQVHAARALLSWTQRDLAERAGVPETSVRAFESADTPVMEENGAGARLVTALQRAGILFLEDNGDGIGVRVRSASRDEGLRPDQLTADNDG